MNIFQDTPTIITVISATIMLVCISIAISVSVIALYRSRPLDERTRPLLAKYLAIVVTPSVLAWSVAYMFESVFYVTPGSEIARIIIYTALPALITASACIYSIISLRRTSSAR